MSAPNYVITEVDPWDRRPLHPSQAAGRGLSENFDDVFIVQGFSTGGALKSPLEYQGRFFRPFASHRGHGKPSTVTVVHTNGTTTTHEGIQKIKRVRGADGAWLPNTIALDQGYSYDSKLKGMVSKVTTITDAASWSQAKDGTTPDMQIPFSVKAVELTAKEIAGHQASAKSNEYQIPAGSKKQA
jgi:hypothetical protein